MSENDGKDEIRFSTPYTGNLQPVDVQRVKFYPPVQMNSDDTLTIKHVTGKLSDAVVRVRRADGSLEYVLVSEESS